MHKQLTDKEELKLKIQLLHDCGLESTVESLQENENDGSLTMNYLMIDGRERLVAWLELPEDNHHRGIAYFDNGEIITITQLWEPEKYAKVMKQFE